MTRKSKPASPPPGSELERLTALRREVNGLLRDARQARADLEAAVEHAKSVTAELAGEWGKAAGKLIAEMLHGFGTDVMGPLLDKIREDMIREVNIMRARILGEAEQLTADSLGAPNIEAVAEMLRTAQKNPAALRARVLGRAESGAPLTLPPPLPGRRAPEQRG